MSGSENLTIRSRICLPLIEISFESLEIIRDNEILSSIQVKSLIFAMTVL